MKVIEEIPKPTRCIIHFKQDDLVPHARTPLMQVIIDTQREGVISPSGEHIRFNFDGSNEVHGWVKVADIVIDEELEEMFWWEATQEYFSVNEEPPSLDPEFKVPDILKGGTA